MPTDRLSAADVLNWSYLCKISEYIEPRAAGTNIASAIAVFAYSITSTADMDTQDEILADLLTRATYMHCAESAEAVLKTFARLTRSNLELIREFARQVGIRLKRN